MSKEVVRVAKPLGLGLSLVLAFLVGALLSTVDHPVADAAVLNITTSAVDAGQIGVPYLYSFQADGGNSLGASGGTNWRIVGSDSATLASYGLSMDSAGTLRGIPNRMLVNFPFQVQCDSNGASPAQRAFTLTIAGRMVFTAGPRMPSDSTVLAGQANVPMFQFTVQAVGEDIDLTSLRLYGLGSGSDSFDVANVKIWDDANSNGVVNAGEQQIIPSTTFRTTEGFLSSFVSFSFNTNILRIDSNVNSGTRCLLVTYDFKSTVLPSRTFRLALERSDDLGYKTITTGKTFPATASTPAGEKLGGGSPYSQYNNMTMTWMPDSFFLAAYKGGVMTIGGETPAVTTLFVNTTRDMTGPRLVRAGAETTAMSLELWADTSHTITVKRIIITDSGTGDAATQIEKGILYLDNDRSGTLSSGDQQIMEATFAGDLLTFNDINRDITTPTALRTDPGALYLVVAYKFKTTVPVTTPNLTFQSRLAAASDVSGIDKNLPAISATISPSDPNLWGAHIAMSLPVDTSVVGGTTDGPYIRSATWYDVDTNRVASSGDTILVLFDTNINSTMPTADKFLLPVLGDYLGNNASVSFLGGNRVRITLGAFTKLTIPGTFSTITENSPSAIDLRDTTSGITSLYGRTAGPAVSRIDIDSAVVSYTSSSSSPGSSSDTSTSGSSSTGRGDNACLIGRTPMMAGWAAEFRAIREWLLASSAGRLIAALYHLL